MAAQQSDNHHAIKEMTTDSERAHYVYGIVAADCHPPARFGIDGRHPLELVVWKDLRAVTSEVSLTEFGEAPLQNRLKDLDWLPVALRTHEVIVEEVMRRQTILACKFCTIYRSAVRLQDLLDQHYQRYLEALTYLRDKEEWGVKVYADEHRLRTHLLTSDDTLRARHQTLQEKPPGLAYLLQKKLHRALTERLEETLVRLSQQVSQALIPHVIQAAEVSSAVVPPATSGARLFLNAAYLIAKSQVSTFADGCQALDGRLTCQGARLVLSGPWPPYHFSPRLA